MMSRSIYQQVAELHALAINQGFLSELGPRFLTLLYEAIDEASSSILIVDVDNQIVRGFVSGGTDLWPVYKILIKRLPAVIFALFGAIFRYKNLIRIVELLLHTNKATSTSLPRAELYSIAVLPELRGQGVAQKLYVTLQEEFAARGISEFKIVVGDELEAAQRFYRQLGAMAISNVSLHGTKNSILFLGKTY